MFWVGGVAVRAVHSMIEKTMWQLKGPVALKLNCNDDIELLQLGAAAGVLADEFRAHLAEREVRLRRTR